jgi:hypothetical protein
MAIIKVHYLDCKCHNLTPDNIVDNFLASTLPTTEIIFIAKSDV